MLGWELPPHNSGGLGVACLELTRALAANGADIEFVLPYYANQQYPHMNVTSAFSEAVDTSSMVSVYDSPYLESNTKVFRRVTVTNQQAAFEKAVSSIVSQTEFDIIHAHDWLTFRAGLAAKWLSGKPLVVHVHSIERDRAGGNSGNQIVREIEATAMMLADQVIAVSEQTKRAIIEDYLVPAEKIDVVHNSVNPEDFLPLDEENDYRYLSSLKAQGWKVVTYVGRLTIQKGLTHLVRALAAAMVKYPKTVLLLIGSGEQRDEVIRLAADLGIADRVLFADFQRGKRLRDGFKTTDLFVMPSVSEPFGLVALEAVGYGVPVLVSKQSGVAEVLTNCLKVDYWDIDGMANQIAGVLNNQSLGDELSRNASKEFNRMSWHRSAGLVLDIYKSHVRVIT